MDARDVARRLLLHLLTVLSPSGEVVIGIDDTIERRWGGKIKGTRHLSERRDATAMVGPGHPTYDTGGARPLPAGDRLGGRIDTKTQHCCASPSRRLDLWRLCVSPPKMRKVELRLPFEGDEFLFPDNCEHSLTLQGDQVKEYMTNG
jgi:hypothetical protein